ncbi:class I SAM-dependent methyltransferase [Clostridium botulinum]|uniref:SAM-dependent methyltransferase n=1 Tax=Clostridium botulinum TaxID=1491 RepID=A0A6B4JMA4_CLOBO|nr:class I SAM-dependent methyltransferase [Clostridium botulinum]EES50404.1 Bcl-2 family protein [Clostridium botulinum E1 str. 'BoNT E Beluga']MBY6761417.1 SAM-dependent methyltransferase [Clostridium botulinum]MBY6920251.1 SAM-dependent methyltransferase [Clostridium botulinum]MCR1131141.1 class I SAM-dependent methyltransferase [Clostridium botulinum]NFH68618.1 SAM-dependent methyltransferase [Clostridium botulinum]
MDLSKRLNWILEYVDKCNTVMDVGTDHGYIPIYLVKNKIVEKAIASDINKDPLQKAKINASLDGVIDKIDLRLGGGLSPLKKNEVQGVIIAGMGGNLIRDILEKDINKVRKLDYLILQPAQNPEVLREYLYNSNYEILNEDLCFDEGQFYELFKVKYKIGENTKLDPIFYEISPVMLKENNKLIKEYIKSKIEKYNKILSFIKEETETAKLRKEEIHTKIKMLEDFIR